MILCHGIARFYLRRSPPVKSILGSAYSTMTTSTRQQPPWQAPELPELTPPLPPLKIYNSLTRSKTPFVPIDWQSKSVSWYACGPTVYDDSHLGHARNYVTTDIIRRIMSEYFGFKVHFVMNITDVDDKIILRGRQQYLLERFVAENASKPNSQHSALETAHAAMKAYVAKNLPLIPFDLPPEEIVQNLNRAYRPIDGELAGDKEAKLKMHLQSVRTATNAILSLEAGKICLETFFVDTQDILLPYLDSLHGSTIDAEDHSIFTKLTRRFEDRFTEDMRALNCRDPDVVTRVTEYVPQIVEFVKKIKANGYAYMTSDGSVYFDIEAFEADRNHYAKLEPWNRNDADLRADGEGSLSKKTSEKKSDADFALWKSSKSGEPSWHSPWGKGRPGWHIECSAMASDQLGSRMDIHSGGIDLAFPHHDNELAQSEAYWVDKSHMHDLQWVNYFIHMGHLHIQGSKMSKSLKNFTTVKNALAAGDWTPRSLRIIFLQGGWREGIEITGDTIKAGSAWEDKVNNFFVIARDMIADDETSAVQDVTLRTSRVSLIPNGKDLVMNPELVGNSKGPIDTQSTNVKEMQQALNKARKETYEALCDSFNTPLAMTAISELITVFNVLEKTRLTVDLVWAVASWVTGLVNLFGLNGEVLESNDYIGWSGISIPVAAKPYVYPLARLRDELRRKARSKDGLTQQDLDSIYKSKSADSGRVPIESEPYARVADRFTYDIGALKKESNFSKAVLQLCDRLRDVDLWNVGIYLEDREGDRPALVRTVTKELVAAKREKEEREINKERQKQKAKEDAEREAAEKSEKGKLSHLEMFRSPEYSEWDENGIPLKDKQGEEIAKSKRKKLVKDWQRQKKLHEQWLETTASGGS